MHGALFHGLSSRRHQRDGCHGGAFVHEHVVQRIFVGDEQVCADVELGNAELDHLNDIFIWCTNADLSALTLNVSMPSGTTISGTCITANTDGSYTLNMTNSDKTITVTNGSMSRNYYMAVTKVGESITVSIRFNTDRVSGSTQAESLQSKMRTASVGSTGTLYVTLSDSKTVMDALLAASSTAGFTVNYTNSSYGAYVTGIEGLNAGGAAGWMYKVNGVMPMTGAGNYTLQNGDTIVWGYVTSYNDSFE